MLCCPAFFMVGHLISKDLLVRGKLSYPCPAKQWDAAPSAALQTTRGWVTCILAGRQALWAFVGRAKAQCEEKVLLGVDAKRKFSAVTTEVPGCVVRRTSHHGRKVYFWAAAQSGCAGQAP
jgi:hypothetical protein